MWYAARVPLQEGLVAPAAESTVSPSGTVLSAESPSPKVIALPGDSISPMADGCKSTRAWASQPELRPSERQLELQSSLQLLLGLHHSSVPFCPILLLSPPFHRGNAPQLLPTKLCLRVGFLENLTWSEVSGDNYRASK